MRLKADDREPPSQRAASSTSRSQVGRPSYRNLLYRFQPHKLVTEEYLMAHSQLFPSTSDVLLARDGGTNPPPEVVATWPAPNLVNPEERGWGAPIILMVLLLLTLLVFIARIRARVMVRNAGIDDILMSVAILPVIGLTISTILGIRVYGFQRHVWDQTPATKIDYSNITMAIELSYMVGSTLVKVSILFLYRRLTGSLTNKENNCQDEGIVLISATAVSTVQDLIISFLPLFLIRNLQMPKRQKLAMGGIFGLGLITTVCGIMRTYYLVFVYHYTYDVTWYGYYGWTWTAIEADLGVICASVPALRVYFRHRLGSTAAHTSNSRSNNQNGPKTLSNQGYGSRSAKSNKNADVEANGDHMSLQSIVIKRDLSSSIRERDDASQKSDSSTRNLTTIIHGPL
ncbi:hypothetical protein yc1106_01426 [Curvularia clavata]|uniref:Rhodopsin domain-containing protein n=1 Tax=Curvularia clavata TaxID=95742 RepID=A0A9Q9DP44_CURCL|nr:hypothetical protein yc1106_01426 [Curvularia clavata]